MIQEHIHSLLFEHDCVIIPDFGGLISHYEPARIHPVKHSFLPPAKRIAFNQQLKLNDGLLISTFAYTRHISQEDAQQQVAAFVRGLKTELQASQRFELKGIGVFRLNAERKIEFDYIPNENFLNDSFGLPELIARPVLSTDAAAGLRTLLKEKQHERAVSTAKPTLRKKVRRIYDIASVFAITGLTVSALYFISLQTDYSLSSLNPFALFNNTADKNITSLPDQAEPEQTPAPEETFSETDFISETTSADSEMIDSANPGAEEGPIVTESAPAKDDITAAVNAELKKAEAIKKEEIKAEEKIIPVAKPVAKPIVKAPVKTEAAVSKLASKVNRTTIEAGSDRYYIIAGGFAEMKNAEWCQRQLNAKGANSKVIMPFMGSALHRVTITDFDTKEEALQQLPGLKQKFGKNIWILNY